jgi:hypothetical protein
MTTDSTPPPLINSANLPLGRRLPTGRTGQRCRPGRWAFSPQRCPFLPLCWPPRSGWPSRFRPLAVICRVEGAARMERSAIRVFAGRYASPGFRCAPSGYGESVGRFRNPSPPGRRPGNPAGIIRGPALSTNACRAVGHGPRTARAASWPGLEPGFRGDDRVCRRPDESQQVRGIGRLRSPPHRTTPPAAGLRNRWAGHILA